VRISDHVFVVLAPSCLLVAGALYTGVSVVREVMDDHGRVVIDANGEAVLVVAAWETWEANWMPNVLFLLAAVLLLRWFYQEIVARHFRTRTEVHETGGA
jgi:hypothetical protein